MELHRMTLRVSLITLLVALTSVASAQDAEAPPAEAPPAAEAPAAEAPPAEAPAAEAPPAEPAAEPAPAPEPEPDGASARGGVSMSLDDFAGGGESDGGDGGSPLTDGSGFILGAKLGGGIGTSDFGASFVAELEIGYALPFANRALEVFVSGQYTQPKTDGVEGQPDARLPDPGSFAYEVTQQELGLTLGLLYRIDIGSELLMPYGGLGGRMYMLNTKVKGDASGEPFGENEETQNDFGFVVIGGVDIFVGPGALLAELSWGWAALDGYVMRDTDVGQLNLAIGYRLML